MGAPATQSIDLLGFDGRVDDEDASGCVVGERRVLALAEAVLPHDDLFSGLDPADPLAMRVDQCRLHVGDRLDSAAMLCHDRHLRARALQQLRHEAVHDRGALEDVGVLEDVRLVCEHLLDAQRPLLIPRPRQAQRLVPRRQLDGARARVAPERDGQGLEHDALHVVLRL